MHETTWILIANSAKARIYLTHKAKLFVTTANENDLTLLKEYAHPASQKRDRELVSDNSGRYHSSERGSDTFDAPTDPKKYEENRFAQQLYKVLHEACHDKQFHELILIAAPAFMGMLNKHISHDEFLQRSVCAKIEKDYIEFNERELVKHLQAHL